MSAQQSKSKTKHKWSTVNGRWSISFGFTLVEILVAITILATLTVGLISTINPRGQINKAQDSVRIQDLRQIKIALDLYYNDKNCYPAMTSSSFSTALSRGGEWKEGNTVYMKKVSKDPSNTPYIYTTDETVCPQWGVVFAKLTQPLASACSLSAKSNCAPQGFDSSWACSTLGITNCSTLIAGGIGSGSFITSPIGTPSSSLTPTPALPVSDQDFYVAQPPGTNPEFYQGTISPLFQAIDKTQKLSVMVADSVANVSSVSATIKSDTKTQTYNMELTAGTVTDGTWEASWTLNDTTIKQYLITLNGTDSLGNTSSFDISIK